MQIREASANIFRNFMCLPNWKVLPLILSTYNNYKEIITACTHLGFSTLDCKHFVTLGMFRHLLTVVMSGVSSITSRTYLVCHSRLRTNEEPVLLFYLLQRHYDVMD